MPAPANLAKRRPTAQVLLHHRVVVHNLTQEELGRRADIDPSIIATWEMRAPVSVESWRKLQAVMPDLPEPWAFDPPLNHNYTGQRSRPPAGVETLEAERAKIKSIVLIPDADPDGYYTS